MELPSACNIDDDTGRSMMGRVESSNVTLTCRQERQLVIRNQQATTLGGLVRLVIVINRCNISDMSEHCLCFVGGGGY